MRPEHITLCKRLHFFFSWQIIWTLFSCRKMRKLFSFVFGWFKDTMMRSIFLRFQSKPYSKSTRAPSNYDETLLILSTDRYGTVLEWAPTEMWIRSKDDRVLLLYPRARSYLKLRRRRQRQWKENLKSKKTLNV